jgi:hypothetical protein
MISLLTERVAIAVPVMSSVNGLKPDSFTISAQRCVAVLMSRANSEGEVCSTSSTSLASPLFAGAV